MVNYDGFLGSVLIGSWLSAMLYGVVVCKTCEYLFWYSASGDSRARKGLLLCCTISSSIGMATQLANVYYTTVTFWGNTVEIHKRHWPAPVYLIANCLTCAMVDAFLIRRVYLLSRILWLALFLAFCVVLGLAGGIMLAVTLAMESNISSRDSAAVIAPIWTIGTAAGDIFIAAALIWKLTTMRTSFQATNSLIQRLVIGAIQTGSATSTVAIAALVAYFTEGNRGNVKTALHYLVSPMYMLTLLYNLNLLRHRDEDASVGDSDLSATRLTRPNVMWMSRETRLTGPNTMCLDSMHLHRTVVSVDPPEEDVPRSTVSEDT